MIGLGAEHDVFESGTAFRPASRTEAAGFTYATPDQTAIRRGLIRTVECLGGQRRLKRLYESWQARQREGETFFATAVRLLELDVRFDRAALERVPATGPVLFVANHPFGVLDGIVLTWLAMQVRPDIRVLAHSALNRVPAARANLLPVDFSGTDAALATNLATRRTATTALSAGKAIGLFPGGGVSTVASLSARRAMDLPWAPFTAKLIRAARPTVIPVHFSGQNGRLFQMASHVSLTLRQSLIMRETARRIGATVDVAIGAPIEADHLAPFADRGALLLELRRRTYELAPGGTRDWMQTGRIRSLG